MSSQLEGEVGRNSAGKAVLLAMVAVTQQTWSRKSFMPYDTWFCLDTGSCPCTLQSWKRRKIETFQWNSHLIVSPFSLSPPLGCPGAIIRLRFTAGEDGDIILFWRFSHAPDNNVSVLYFAWFPHPPGLYQRMASKCVGSLFPWQWTKRQTQLTLPCFNWRSLTHHSHHHHWQHSQ